MLNQLTHESFQPYLDQTFQLKLEEEALELRLQESITIGADPEDGKRHPFSVVFVGPEEPVLPQQIYELSHAGLGTLPLFLVPVGPNKDGQGMRYEAVFT